MLISIVIPARDEADNLPGTLAGLERALAGIPHETVVVDDHSGDGTGALVRRLAGRHPALRLVENRGPGGFAAALWTGFRAAAGEGVVVMMADACDDPATVPLMREKFLAGADLVAASRYRPGGGKEGGPRLQGFCSALVNRLLRLVFRLPLSDASNAFKLYRRSLLLEAATREPGFALSLELALFFWSRGARLAEVPTRWRGRTAGKSKFRVRRAFAAYGRQVLRALK